MVKSLIFRVTTCNQLSFTRRRSNHVSAAVGGVEGLDSDSAGAVGEAADAGPNELSASTLVDGRRPRGKAKWAVRQSRPSHELEVSCSYGAARHSAQESVRPGSKAWKRHGPTYSLRYQRLFW